MNETWTVGLVTNDTVRTFIETSYEDARKHFKEWSRCFLNNNNVESYTTTTERDEIENVVYVLKTFRVKNQIGIYKMFICKNEEY